MTALSRYTPPRVINLLVERQTELMLVGRLRAGDPEAFDQVYAGTSHVETPFELASAHQLHHRLEQALQQLPTADREVLLLIAAEGFTPAEAAAICGVSAEALRQRLSRARAQLTRRLETLQSSRTRTVPLNREPQQS